MKNSYPINEQLRNKKFTIKEFNETDDYLVLKKEKPIDQVDDKETDFLEIGRRINWNLQKLNYRDEYLFEKYRIDEEDLDKILFGEQNEVLKEISIMIDQDLINEVNARRKEYYSASLYRIIKRGKHFENKEFYKNLRAYWNMRQEDLAKKLNVKVTTIRRWEQGVGPASGSSQIILTLLIPVEVRLKLLGKETEAHQIEQVRLLNDLANVEIDEIAEELASYKLGDQ